MEDDFDIVAVRVEQESRILARMIGPLTRPAIVRTAMGEACGMTRIGHGSILGLKRDVLTPRQHAMRGVALGGRDEQFVRPEMVLRFAPDGDGDYLEIAP